MFPPSAQERLQLRHVAIQVSQPAFKWYGVMIRKIRLNTASALLTGAKASSQSMVFPAFAASEEI